MTEETTLQAMLRQADIGGVFHAKSSLAAAALQAAEAMGMNAWHLHLDGTETDDELLRRLGESLRFPTWYGSNWDALADCLADLSWCDTAASLLCISGCAALAAKRPASYALLSEVLGEAAAFWRGDDVPFWVLLDSPAPPLPMGQS